MYWELIVLGKILGTPTHVFKKQKDNQNDLEALLVSLIWKSSS